MKQVTSRVASALVVALALHHFAYTQAQRTESPMKVNVSAQIEKSDRDLLTINVVIKNDGNSSVYVATRPVRSDGSSGPYVTVDPEDFSRLVVAMRFYPLPTFEVFKYDAGLHLDLLTPGNSYTEKLNVPTPLRTTEPPFSDRPGTRLIPPDSIRSVQVQVGVLPASEALSDLVRRKVSHDLFTGMEVSDGNHKDRSISIDQELFASAPVAVDLKSQVAQRVSTPLHESGHVDPPKPQ
jgi:hypothetical protein